MSNALPAIPESGGRCFIALLPDVESRRVLRRCRESLEHASAGLPGSVRWLDPAALHLTLRFLGATDAAQVQYFKRVLPALAGALPALASRRYGVWPNRARPRMLVLELAAGTRLAALAHACEAHARAAQFAPEARAFRAHVTVARLRPGAAFGTLPKPPSPLRFDTLALMQSQLAAVGSSYRALATEPLR